MPLRSPKAAAASVIHHSYLLQADVNHQSQSQDQRGGLVDPRTLSCPLLPLLPQQQHLHQRDELGGLNDASHLTQLDR